MYFPHQLQKLVEETLYELKAHDLIEEYYFSDDQKWNIEWNPEEKPKITKLKEISLRFGLSPSANAAMAFEISTKSPELLAGIVSLDADTALFWRTTIDGFGFTGNQERIYPLVWIVTELVP